MQVAVIDAPNPVAAAFSPKNTYLTVFQRPQPGAGNAEKNLKVGVGTQQPCTHPLLQQHEP